MKRGSSGHRWLWIIIGSGAYLLHLLVGKNSAIVENFYSRGIFAGFRQLWNHTLGYSSVPLLYVLLAAVVAWAVLKILSRVAKEPPKSGGGDAGGVTFEATQQGDATSPLHYRVPKLFRASLAPRIGRGALLVGSRLGILVFFFYALWGFNYDRIGVEKQLGLDVAPQKASLH